jgi:CheY-like chemotaxis protein
MPLVPADPDLRPKTSGMQSVLVFSDERRAMGLMIDAIVDIVEERVDFALASTRPGLVGSAVIRGEATEIIDFAHFLPLAFDDWQRWNEQTADNPPRNILLVDDAVFFRDMLAPVLEAAGYAVACVASAKAALSALGAGRRFDVIVADLDMPEMDGFDLAQAIRANPRTADIPVIGLSSAPGLEKKRARPARRVLPDRRQIRPQRAYCHPAGVAAAGAPAKLEMRMKGLVSEYVAVGLAGQLFGLSISRVQDVFVPERVTRIPLAPAEIAGLVNVRGRILTVIDMWRRLGLEPPSPEHRPLAVASSTKMSPTHSWSKASVMC